MRRSRGSTSRAVHTSHNTYVPIKGYKRSASGLRKHRKKIKHEHYVKPEQFKDARVFSGLTREQAADLLKVSLRTIGHWETGKTRPSFSAFKLLRIYRHGDLFHPAWNNYKINRGGKLVTPEGHEIAPWDVAWLSLLVRRAQLARHLRRERDELRERLAAREREDGKAASEAAALGSSLLRQVVPASVESCGTLAVQGVAGVTWKASGAVAWGQSGPILAPCSDVPRGFSPVEPDEKGVEGGPVCPMGPSSNTGQKLVGGSVVAGGAR